MTVPTSPPRRYAEIRGWFPWVDRMLFSRLLEAQTDVPGDLVELGAYLGKSAVIIGSHRREGERFVVVDLFGAEAVLGDSRADRENRRELNASYASLTREAFEGNYRALRGDLPEIVQGLSSEITEHVEPNSVRFLHVDASHLFEPVVEDARNAKSILGPGGIVVFDDFRSPHTPAVAAAVWGAVLNEGLIPFAVTQQKLYGVYDDPEPYLAAVRNFVAADQRFELRQSRVLEHVILRVKVKPQPTAPQPVTATPTTATAALDKPKQPEAKRPAKKKPPTKSRAKSLTSKAEESVAGQRRVRRVLRDLCPPLIARWIRRNRRRRRSTGR